MKFRFLMIITAIATLSSCATVENYNYSEKATGDPIPLVYTAYVEDKTGKKLYILEYELLEKLELVNQNYYKKIEDKGWLDINLKIISADEYYKLPIEERFHGDIIGRQRLEQKYSKEITLYNIKKEKLELIEKARKEYSKTVHSIIDSYVSKRYTYYIRSSNRSSMTNDYIRVSNQIRRFEIDQGYQPIVDDFKLWSDLHKIIFEIIMTSNNYTATQARKLIAKRTLENANDYKENLWLQELIRDDFRRNSYEGYLFAMGISIIYQDYTYDIEDALEYKSNIK